MANISFTCTKLIGSNKEGIITPDANGYYRQLAGGLNCYNSANEFYVYEGACDIFRGSSTFQRRVKEGCLFAENGHPNKLPHMTMNDYFERIMTIDEGNVCGHIAEVTLRDDLRSKYNGTVPIEISVCPDGVHAEIMRNAFKNPKRNVCFSIRALTRDEYVNGVNRRKLVTVVTFDMVNESGIGIARKFDSPALESIVNHAISPDRLKVIADKILNNAVALESTKEMALEMIYVANREMNEPRSIFTGWR